MSASHAVTVSSTGLIIGDERLPLYSGSVHYWRHEREQWSTILNNVAQMGFHFLQTYVPWSAHELEEGVFDFGDVDPRKDVAAFLEACAAADLHVLIRPGPHINSEIPYFGFPPRVLTDPNIQMRTARNTPALLCLPGTPFAAPSYACERLYEETGRFFDALCPIIAPYLYPKGPIVAIQADNEMGMFFRLKCYDVDYHPESIELYQNWLKAKYGTIATLNKFYQESAYQDFVEISPPRFFDAQTCVDLPYYVDWAEYQEYYLHHGIIRIKAMLEARGLTGVPYYHNYPVSTPNTPFRPVALETELEIAGVDAYPLPAEYDSLKRSVNYISTVSRLPFIPEFGSGTWAYYRSPTVAEERFTTRTVFMHGLRAINYYMLADRDRWSGAPIKRDGSIRNNYFELYAEWNKVLEALEWYRLQPERDVLVLTPRLYERLKYTAVETCFPNQFLTDIYHSLPDDLFVSESTLGLRDAIQHRASAWLQAFEVALAASGVPFALGDSDLSEAKLAEYELIIVPTFEWADSELLSKLERYARNGGAVLCGPRWPQYNINGSPLNTWHATPSSPASTAGRLEFVSESGPTGLWTEDVDLWDKNTLVGTESIVQLATSDEMASDIPFAQRVTYGDGSITLVAAAFPRPGAIETGMPSVYAGWSPWLKTLLASSGIEPKWQLANTLLDISILSDNDRRLVCVANPQQETQTGEINIVGVTSWRDIDRPGPQGVSTGSRLDVTLEPWSVKIWEVKG